MIKFYLICLIITDEQILWKMKKKNNLRKAVYRVRYLSDNCFLGNYYKFCLLMMQLYEKIYMITLKQLNFLSSTTNTELILHV